MNNSRLSAWLSKANPFVFSLYAIIAAFCTYSCLYAFRKAFAVATFEGLSFWGIDYKIWLITAQVLGYTLSKFIGIKVVSEMSGKNRFAGILLISGMAFLSLLAFALAPQPYNIIFLFLNGLPLGMGWGLVFSYLEGRRTTEVLGAGLSVSFIFSAGLVRSVGSFVMLNWGVSQFWMPFVTGLLFIFPLFIFLWLLNKLPPPSELDEKLRTKRAPMNGKERIKFIKTFALGLVLLIVAYLLLTAFRDFRDNFSAEIWKSLGYGNSPEIFILTEIPIAILVMLIISLVMLVKNNQKALMINHLIILVGFLMVGFSTWAFQNDLLNAPVWMILVGLGLYLGYVPFNTIFFDRMIAAFRYVSNVGFLIYLADSFGYLGSVAVLFYKNFGQADLSWLEFFIAGAYILAIFGSILILASAWYFWKKYQSFQPIIK